MTAKMPNTLEHFSNATKQRVEITLDRALSDRASPWVSGSDFDVSRIFEAMRYAILGGGKRLRAMLVYSAYESLSGIASDSRVDALAAAIECIHAYSLVHDDLPAMDDDALRRGKPTTHIAFDEATAILAGDALQSLAFELICDSGLSHQQIQAAVKVLASASGALGMVGGQQFDLLSENRTITLDALKNLHAHKTGALIRAAATLGAIAANADKQQRLLLDTYASHVGLAFQVVDDILDIESDTVTLGKQQGADVASNKATYPALMGLEASKRYAEALYNEALAALEQLNLNNKTLALIAKYIVIRSH